LGGYLSGDLHLDIKPLSPTSEIPKKKGPWEYTIRGYMEIGKKVLPYPIIMKDLRRT